jgi:hypothetical protein
MGANIIDYIASFVILLSLLTITVTVTTQTLDSIYNYHSSQQMNTRATNLLNDLTESTGFPIDWAQGSTAPTSIGFRWAVGEGSYINPFAPMRLMNSSVTHSLGPYSYNDFSSATLSPWPNANLNFKVGDAVTYDEASKLLDTNGSYGWRVTYNPSLNITLAPTTLSTIPWYQGWGYRQALTIDHTQVPELLTNYPFLISLTQQSIAQNARSDGGDILFTTSDKVTKIPHEIDSYDSSTGHLLAWVKIPQLSNSVDTVIYIYYGNPTASNQGLPSQVWSGYNLVSHLSDNPDSSHTSDSSSNGLTGTKSGDSEPAQTNGVISFAQNFDGSKDYITLNQGSLTGGLDVYQMWLKSVQSTSPQTILTSGFKNNTQGFIDISRPSSSDDLSFDYATNSNWISRINGLNDGVKINCVTSFNGKIYGGTSDGSLNEWDGVSNIWVQRVAPLNSQTSINCLKVFNGKLYGGTSPGGRLFEWTTGATSWTERAPQLGDETDIYSLVVFDPGTGSKLYGGTSPGGKLYEWDGIDAWISHGSPEIRCLAYFNGKIYGGTGTTGSLYEWDPVNFQWIQRAAKLGSETDIYSLAVFNNKLYGGTGPNGNLFEWDGTSTWIQRAAKLGSETDIYSLAVFNNKLYGGTGPNGNLFEWDGTSTWIQRAAKLGSETDIYSLAVFNNKLYGGTGPNGNLFEWSPQSAPSTITNVTITITNSQTSSTPNPFQQMVTWNPSSFTAYEASNLGNIRFYSDSALTTPIYAWLESCTPSISNTGISATAWVRLTTPIAPNGGSLKIYMAFRPTSTTYDGIYWGEAPQLSGTYGQYDNGALVFNQYGGASWSGFTTYEGAWDTANGYLEQTSSSFINQGGGPAALIQSTSYPNNGQYVIETAFSYSSQAVARVGIIAVAGLSGNDPLGYRFIGQQSNNGAGFVSFLNDLKAWVVSGSYGGSVTTAYTMQVVDNGGTWSGALFSGYGVGGSILTSLAPTAYTAANNVGGTSGYVGVCAARYDGSNIVGNPASFQWFRLRACPPNNVMPTVSFGSLNIGNTGSRWIQKAPMLGSETNIYSLAVFNNKLYGGTGPNGNLFEWDGTSTWIQRAAKLASETSILSLTTFNGKLYGSTSPNGLLYGWDGTSAWALKAAKLGSETAINALAVDTVANKLYGGTSPNGMLYEWDGASNWINRGANAPASDTSINSLTVFNGKLYGGTSPNGMLLEWNNANAWVQRATQFGSETSINSLVVFDPGSGSKLYGSTGPSGSLLVWDNNNQWTRRVNYNSIIQSIIAFNGNIYCGTSTGRLFIWNSAASKWDKKANCLGSLSAVDSLAVFNNLLYGGTTDGRLFQWNGTSAWILKAPQLSGQAINSLTVYNSKLYGGTSPSGSLFEWDGTNTWIQRAGQLNSQTSISSLTVFNSKLYGGTSPGGHLFEWTTGATIWTERASQLGSETTINALVSFNNKLYGSTSPGGRLFEWDGTNNIWIGKTYILGAETSILSMAVYNGKLYGGTSPNGLLYEWDGATKWVKMANSMNSQAAIPALTVFNNKLYGASQGDGYLFECSDSGSRIVPNFFTGYSNTWLHVVLVANYATGRVDIYRNGLIAGSLTSASMIAPTSGPKYIGAYVVAGIANSPYSGGLDELRISQTNQDANWIKMSYNNELNPSSFITVNPNESIFFRVSATVTAKNGPVSNAALSGTLIYCLPGVTAPGYSQLSSQTVTTDSSGIASLDFRGYTSTIGVYFILVRANHAGVEDVGYYVSSPISKPDPVGVFVTNYENGTLTLVHRRDMGVPSFSSSDVGYNTTFAMPVGASSYRSVSLNSAGLISVGTQKTIQLGVAKDNPGVLLTFLKTDVNTYGLTFTPWGVSSLNLKATFGAPIMDATNVITKTRMVNIESYSYEVKVQMWKIGGG